VSNAENQPTGHGPKGWLEKGPAAVCNRCGRPAVVEIEGQSLCEECYQLPGSCCMEFGADDLWKEDQR
jgi:hypothetical protein